MEEQIRLFYEEMNDTLRELDAVGRELDKTEGFETERLAAEVRDLRKGMRKVDEVLIQAATRTCRRWSRSRRPRATRRSEAWRRRHSCRARRS